MKKQKRKRPAPRPKRPPAPTNGSASLASVARRLSEGVELLKTLWDAKNAAEGRWQECGNEVAALKKELSARVAGHKDAILDLANGEALLIRRNGEHIVTEFVNLVRP